MKPPADITLKPASELSRLSIIVDTREQRPWNFPEELATVRRGTLNYGDYALDGDHFCIERKNLDDFVGTISSGWERFVAELNRMPLAPARVVIVEGSLLDIMQHKYRAGVVPSFVTKRIAELALSGITVLLCDNDLFAAGMAYSILKRRQEHLGGVAS